MRHHSAVLLFLSLLASGCAIRRPAPPRETWDDPALWQVSPGGESTAGLTRAPGPAGDALRLDYALRGDYSWIELKHDLPAPAPDAQPVSFGIMAQADCNLEMKFCDPNGSVFGIKIPLAGAYTNWTKLVVYRSGTEYWWGGDDRYDGLSQWQFAVSGRGTGTVWFDEVGLDRPGLPASFLPGGPALDPDRNLPGIGFRQRRAEALIPEDPLVLEGLRQLQDVSSPERQLLPSMENNECQTFNNALVAMAFILKGEKERAERILDWFAKATVRTNEDPTLQNFFYKGEARGFFQAVNLVDDGTARAYHTFKPADRWMGDMAWLMFAYLYYEKEHGKGRYDEIVGLLRDLLVEWYTDDPAGGGYVRHGWREGDARLHEPFGHQEGNLDAYAVFRLLGDHARADKIKAWLDRSIRGTCSPLDLYTWRVVALGRDYLHVLDIPDHDLRYRKILDTPRGRAMGLYDHADISVTNAWLDGVGHIACAYQSAGDLARGWFYANQLDAFLIDREINGVKTRALPYTANTTGGYDWVQPDRGFISVAAWYLFAKNGFNPMTLESIATHSP